MSLWEYVHPEYQRVERRDWEWPERQEACVANRDQHLR
jgi:hypothetical protein